MFNTSERRLTDISAARREEIIDAFIKVSTRKGLDNTTMQDVAQTVGISVGTIYLEFKNKDQLIDAFIKQIFRQMEDYIEGILNQAAPAEKILHDLLVGENRSLFDFFHNNVIKHIRKNIKEDRREFEEKRIDLIKQVLEKGIQEDSFIVDDPAETARLFFLAFGILHGPIVLDRDHEEVVRDAEAMFAFLLKSIKKS
jgi:TetR/AcrR family transcriptional repressor of nem operon